MYVGMACIIMYDDVSFTRSKRVKERIVIQYSKPCCMITARTVEYYSQS